MASTKFSGEQPEPAPQFGDVVRRTGGLDPDVVGKPRRFGLLNPTTLPGAFPQPARWEQELDEAQRMWDRLGLSPEERESEKMELFAPNLAKARREAEQEKKRIEMLAEQRRYAEAQNRREQKEQVEGELRRAQLQDERTAAATETKRAELEAYARQLVTPEKRTAAIPWLAPQGVQIRPPVASREIVDMLTAARADPGFVSKIHIREDIERGIEKNKAEERQKQMELDRAAEKSAQEIRRAADKMSRLAQRRGGRMAAARVAMDKHREELAEAEARAAYRRAHPFVPDYEDQLVNGQKVAVETPASKHAGAKYWEEAALEDARIERMRDKGSRIDANTAAEYMLTSFSMPEDVDERDMLASEITDILTQYGQQMDERYRQELIQHLTALRPDLAQPTVNPR